MGLGIATAVLIYMFKAALRGGDDYGYHGHGKKVSSRSVPRIVALIAVHAKTARMLTSVFIQLKLFFSACAFTFSSKFLHVKNQVYR